MTLNHMTLTLMTFEPHLNPGEFVRLALVVPNKVRRSYEASEL